MKRAIITPPVLPPAALAELKQWLGITTTRDDAPLAALLAAANEVCEAFTGAVPITCTSEEVQNVSACWQTLATRPVQGIASVESIAASGARAALATSAYTAEIDADGTARILLTAPGEATRIAVRFTAGLAASWAALPDGLRHGILRLAAHQHRERDASSGDPVPPAAVAALWRPWRQLRLL